MNQNITKNPKTQQKNVKKTKIFQKYKNLKKTLLLKKIWKFWKYVFLNKKNAIL